MRTFVAIFIVLFLELAIASFIVALFQDHIWDKLPFIAIGISFLSLSITSYTANKNTYHEREKK